MKKLKECCDQAKDELINGNPEGARKMCYSYLHKRELTQAVHQALKRACSDCPITLHPDVSRGKEDTIILLPDTISH